MNHPIQPIETDPKGTLRFKENKIVRYLLDNGGIDMNRLACLKFSDEDRQQFAQLIGYSLSGYGELSYVSDYAYSVAAAMAEKPESTEDEVRIEHLETELSVLRKELKSPVARLFGLHPDDLKV